MNKYDVEKQFQQFQNLKRHIIVYPGVNSGKLWENQIFGRRLPKKFERKKEEKTNAKIVINI